MAEAASDIGAFDLDVASGTWQCTPGVARLFGFDPNVTKPLLTEWEPAIFVDDVAKLRAAIQAAPAAGNLDVEFRVKHADGTLRWLKGRGRAASAGSDGRVRGTLYDISDRKALEARLLALNETLEARVADVREEAGALDLLNRTCISVAAELDLERLVQTVTDAGVALTHAQFGAFFCNLLGEGGESYTLYALSGAPREAFARFPMPRNTRLFDPTFRGTEIVRSPDILADPRYGKNPPHHGMPPGHLGVRSYLAVPVVSRSGEVLGGLFFGHGDPAIFTERAEVMAKGIAAQAAVAIDNARLYGMTQRELAARQQAERELQTAVVSLEKRVAERARELAASATKLEETERVFRLLVEAVTDYAIYMLDVGGNIISWNLGALRIKGYTRDEVIGRHFSIFYREEDRQTPQLAMETAARTGKYEAEGWRVRKDGSTFWAGVVLNAVRDEHGQLIGFAKVTRDLTERQAAEDRLRQAQKMEAVGHLTGGVAHDFNNLLMIIIGNLETLQRRIREPGPDISRLERSADNAMHGARRAEALTQRLLAFSRQQPLDPKPIDVSRLVGGMSDLLRRSIGEQIDVETILAGGLWRANADPNQLEVAILNLAVNSRDAMPNGGKLTIETANVHLDERYAAGQAEVAPGQYVMLAVSDNGTGMTRDVIAKAFDPFFTTKGIGQGTGLGLSQVYGFVKQSGGHVKIYSEPGEGTTVKVYLPRFHSSVSKSETDPVESVARGASSETILVVEDDDDVRSYSSETLRELGYSVVEAEDARSALRLLDDHPEIKIIFTDVGLPGGMNGRHLAEEARRRRSGLKILFATGYARNAIVHDGRLDPGVELITKPFTQAALAAKLRDVIDARSAPARIVVVEDEMLIQLLAVEYLEDAGFKVDAASTGAGGLDKLRRIPGGPDAVVVDVGLPDRKGDLLVREMRSIHPTLPIVVATGMGQQSLRTLFANMPFVTLLDKPYTAENLLSALRHLGISASRG